MNKERRAEIEEYLDPESEATRAVTAVIQELLDEIDQWKLWEDDLKEAEDEVVRLEAGLRLIADRGYQSNYYNSVEQAVQFSDELTDTAKAVLEGKKGPSW